MAFYKQDIVDINLNTGSIFRSFLNHSIGFKNDDADRFGIRCFRDGEPVDLSGASCQAFFMRPDGSNLALTSYGTVSGNVAYVTLPQACYDYEGQFCLSIQLVGGGVTGTMRIVDGMVVNTGASGAVAPTAAVPTYQEILAVYDSMVETLEDYQGVVDGQNTKIDELKSALSADIGEQRRAYQNGNPVNLANPADFVVGEAVNQTNGTFFTASAHARTGYVPVCGGLTYCFAAYGNANTGIRYAFYTSDKTFISGAIYDYLSDIGYLVTAPANARFIAFSTIKGSFPMMIAQRDSRILYFPYGSYDQLRLQALPSVTPEKATFMNNIENLVNPNTCVNGSWVNQTNGAFESGANYKRTDYIQVEPDTDYFVYFVNFQEGAVRYACYDASKVYLSGEAYTDSASGHIIKTHPYAKYIVISSDKMTFPLMVTKSSVAVEFAPYGKGNKNLKYDNLPGIRFEDADFIVKPNNLVGPENWVSGSFVNYANGQFVENQNYSRTGLIEIEPLQTYCIASEFNQDLLCMLAYYDSSQAYISGLRQNLSDIGYLITTPETAKYVAVSFNSNTQKIMVSKSDIRIFYSAYGETTPYLPYENVGKDMNPDDIIINLPAYVYAVVGYELNIYFENLTENWEKYDWDVNCYKGQQWERGYRITPTAADVVSITNLEIIVTDKETGNRKQVSTYLKVIDANSGSGVTKKIIVLGDSTTNNGIVIEKLNENFSNDAMSIEMLGTRGTAPNNHEGRSGWTFYDYFHTASSDGGTVLNPFYNPSTQTFDANYYFANSGVEKPDWFFINLGINDTFGFNSDSDYNAGKGDIIEMCNDMIASVLSASPNTKIGLCLTIPPNHSQDAFGKAYACQRTRNRYKRNNLLWVNDLIKEFNGKQANGIYLIPIYTNLDTVYNMGMESLPVNARNTDITYLSPVGNGGVHPSVNGYWQIADVYTAFIKAYP